MASRAKNWYVVCATVPVFVPRQMHFLVYRPTEAGFVCYVQMLSRHTREQMEVYFRGASYLEITRCGAEVALASVVAGQHGAVRFGVLRKRGCQTPQQFNALPLPIQLTLQRNYANHAEIRRLQRSPPLPCPDNDSE